MGSLSPTLEALEARVPCRRKSFMAIMATSSWPERQLMKSVNIAELKDRLSLYLSRVKAGEEIVIRDRDRPIARLVPLRKGDDDDGQLAVLVAKGLIRLGEGPLDDEFWSLPAPRVSAATLQRVISEERHED